MIRVACPQCGAIYPVADSLFGRMAKCTRCGGTFRLPEAVGGQDVAGASAGAGAPAAAAAPAEAQAPSPSAALAEMAAAASGAPAPAEAVQAPPPAEGPPARGEVPWARPAEGRPAWLKAALALVVAVVVVAGGLLAGAWHLGLGPFLHSDLKRAAAHAGALAEPILARPVPSNDPQQLVALLGDLRKAKAAYDEVLGKAAQRRQDDRLAQIVQDMRRRQQAIDARIGEVEDALWPGPGDPKAMFDRVRKSVPVIEGAEGGMGAGALLEHDGQLCVATCRHVVAGAGDSIRLNFRCFYRDLQGDMVVPVSLGPDAVKSVHRSADLAVIRLREEDRRVVQQAAIRPLKLAPRGAIPAVMDEVWAVGHPHGQEATVTTGRISGVNRNTPRAGKCLQVDATINPGNSGGPVFDSHGRVVGIVTFVEGMVGRPMSYAVQADVLHDLLEKPDASLPEAEIVALVKAPDSRVGARLDQLRDFMAALFESRGQKRVDLQGDPNAPVFQADKGAEYDIVVLKGTRSGVKVQITVDQKVVREFETKVEQPAVPPMSFKAESSARHTIRVTKLPDGDRVLFRVLVFRKK